MNKTWRRGRSVAAVSAAAMATVGLAVVAPAAHAASLTPEQRVVQTLSHLKIGGPRSLTQVQYLNWSGYADNNSGGQSYSAVSGSWIEPTVHCTSNTQEQLAVFWVGLDGLTSSTVEQEGTVGACLNGKTYYFDWWEMYPTNDIQVVASIKAGDKITSTTDFTNGVYTLSVNDLSRSTASFSTQQTCGAGLSCLNSSAEWVAERPGGYSGNGGLYPMPNFGTWTDAYSSVTANGVTGTISSFPDEEMTMVNNQGKVLAQPGPLNAAGTVFRDTWKATE